MTRRHRTEWRVFAAATILAALHGLEDAFGHLGNGVGAGVHAPAGVLAAVVAGGGMLAFARLRPGPRAMLALAFGVLAAANGVLHVRHMAAHGLDLGHLSGVAVLAAGAALIALAGAIPWRHRGRGAATRGRRWARRLAATAAVPLALLLVVVPLTLAVVDSHKFREPVGAPPGAAYETVAFDAADGKRIEGWYRESRNGATILLAHGGGGDRTGSVAHARMLARHGYGVLLYDARGAGRSEGKQNSYGWGWPHDVAGALAFLRERDAGRIGALGLSTGADVLLEVAPDHPELRAVVGDGAAAGSYEDAKRLDPSDPTLPMTWLTFEAIETLTGSDPGRALEEQIPRIAAPVLLISAGTAVEARFNRHYERLGAPALEHWNLPDAHHTAAIREHPAAYERRVVGFFDRALLGGR